MIKLHWREEKILEVLSDTDKMKTQDIFLDSNMSKVTGLKYLYSLKEKGLVAYEKIGPTKLWFTLKKGKKQKIPAKYEKHNKAILKLIKDFEKITGKKAKFVVASEAFELKTG